MTEAQKKVWAGTSWSNPRAIYHSTQKNRRSPLFAQLSLRRSSLATNLPCTWASCQTCCAGRRGPPSSDVPFQSCLSWVLCAIACASLQTSHSFDPSFKLFQLNLHRISEPCPWRLRGSDLVIPNLFCHHPKKLCTQPDPQPLNHLTWYRDLGADF